MIIATAATSVFIIPTAHGWNLLRSTEGNGSWNVRRLESLEEAVPLLTPTDDLVLGLPLTAVLAQRFHLPTSDAAEFPAQLRSVSRQRRFSPRRERTFVTTPGAPPGA